MSVSFAVVRTAFFMGEWVCLDCGHSQEKGDTECPECAELHFYPAEVVMACIDLVNEDGT